MEALRDQVDVGPGDPRGVGGQDDRAVHLGQLRQPLRAELGVEQEPAGADGEHHRVVPHHHQGAPLGLEDAVETGAQRRARGHQCQRFDQRLAAVVDHGGIVPGRQCRAIRTGWPAGGPRGLLRAPQAEGRGDRFGHRAHPDHARHAGPLGGRRRYQRPGEAQSGRLGQTAPAARNLADLAGQADLAEGDQVGRERDAGRGRGHRQGQGQVGGGLDRPDTAGRRHEELERSHGHAGAALSTATTAARRRGSTPWTLRRGPPGSPVQASAWISTRSGRQPCSSAVTTLPGTSGRRSPSSSGPGSATSTRPASPISKSPTSPVGPKRCLTARSIRSEWCRSPSKESTVSTRCSSVRGPARLPSLVTWPTSTTAVPRPLASRASRSTHGPHLGQGPRWTAGLAIDHGLDRVHHHQLGGERHHRLLGLADVGRGQHQQSRRQRSEPRRPVPHLGSRLLARHQQHRPPAGGRRRQDLQDQRRLADARLPEEEGDRAGQQAAGQHPVDLADAGGVGTATVELDVGQRDGAVPRRHGPGAGRRPGLERVPLAALRAPAHPTLGDGAAGPASLAGSGAGHGRTVGGRCDTVPDDAAKTRRFTAAGSGVGASGTWWWARPPRAAPATRHSGSIRRERTSWPASP